MKSSAAHSPNPAGLYKHGEKLQHGWKILTNDAMSQAFLSMTVNYWKCLESGLKNGKAVLEHVSAAETQSIQTHPMHSNTVQTNTSITGLFSL